MNNLLAKNVNRPDHYRSSEVSYDMPECIHVTRNLSFCLGNAYKYVWRSGKKGEKIKEIEDLLKAIWYLNDQIKYSAGKMKIDGTANQIFDLLQFSNDITEQKRKSILKKIITGDLTIAKVEIKDLISHFLWKDFLDPTNEELESICSLIEEKDLPEFILDLKKKSSI